MAWQINRSTTAGTPSFRSHPRAWGSSPSGPAADGRCPRQALSGPCRRAADGTDRLRFVAFDLLAVAGQDVRQRPWEERDARLREALPLCDRIRLVVSQPASRAAHDAIVALGFEGTVLKRPGSTYRAGRNRAWIKLKAQFTTPAELRAVRQDRDGRWHAVCDVDGHRVHAIPARGRRSASAKSSSSSTRASMPTAPCVRRVSRPRWRSQPAPAGICLRIVDSARRRPLAVWSRLRPSPRCRRCATGQLRSRAGRLPSPPRLAS